MMTVDQSNSWSSDRYSDGVFSHALSTERERLELLEASLDPYTFAALEPFAPGPGTRCLEVGGGAGSVARWMARTGADVTAVDLDTTFLEELADEGVHVRRHDVVTQDFAPESFDLIHARYVVIHLPDPAAAIERLCAWLAPGGVLVLEEPAFFPIAGSRHEAYRTAMLDFRAYLESAVGTLTEWARVLPEPLRAAGLTGVDISNRIQRIVGGGSEALWWRLTLEQTRPRMEEPSTDDETWNAALDALANPGFEDLSLAVFTATGRKP